tara:strand:+ start:5230 stop:5418 length:189 start_codon:yes stop_codon:yes gene_type:complete
MTNNRKINDRRVKSLKVKHERRTQMRRQEDVENKLSYYIVVYAIGIAICLLGVVSYFYGYDL